MIEYNIKLKSKGLSLRPWIKETMNFT